MLLFLLLATATAYLEETIALEFNPQNLGISNDCTLYGNSSLTILRFHNQHRPDKKWLGGSDIFAVNNDCDLVVFGYPENNLVKLWRPFNDIQINGTTSSDITTIRPDIPVIGVPIQRFGFSVDVQGQTWVVGAPGTPNWNGVHAGEATMGYAFVYKANHLHSCRSLYDTYCYQDDTSCTKATYKNAKDQYDIKDYQMSAFQQVCSKPKRPIYATGPADTNRIAYFEQQQFGYAVALSGVLDNVATSLYISAPGDTQRFMEDNDGQNYGRVYVWDANQRYFPANVSLPNITWWDYSIKSPLIPPNLASATYRGFGRDIAASWSTLAVSSYPLYDSMQEPFVIVYDCRPGAVSSACIESPDRGIAINDLPGNVLGYLTNAMTTYTDGKTRWPYIPADISTDNLPDFQNNFIGKKIGVTGSNVIIPDHRHNKVYRFGKNSLLRESHQYTHDTNFGTNTQHWALQSGDEVTHLWPCPYGTTSAKEICDYTDKKCIARRCVPCQLQYFSDDGWLEECDPCPRKFTTYREGMAYCDPFLIPIPPGLSWAEMSFIIYVIVGGAVGAYILVILWQYVCITKKIHTETYEPTETEALLKTDTTEASYEVPHDCGPKILF